MYREVLWSLFEVKGDVCEDIVIDVEVCIVYGNLTVYVKVLQEIIQEIEGRGLEVQRHPQLCSKLETSLGYKRSCLKIDPSKMFLVFSLIHYIDL